VIAPVKPAGAITAPVADVCALTPSAVVCQMLAAPSLSEPVKPAQLPVTSLINIQTVALGRSGSAGSAGASAPAPSTPADDTRDNAPNGTPNDKSGASNEPVQKMYCN
jgi:hypothetical protein